MARPISARWVLTQTWCGSAPLHSVSQNARAVALGAGSTRADSQPSCAAISQASISPTGTSQGVQPASSAQARDLTKRPAPARTGRISLAIISPNGPALRTACRGPVVAFSGSRGNTSSAKR